MTQPIIPELPCAIDDLLVFIDDTGHESFAGDQGYYGLGGCVVLGATYNHLKTQWDTARRRINRSPDAPPHAADMKRKPCNYAVLSKFFADCSFARIAVASVKNTPLPVGMHSAVPVMGGLHEDIANLASRIPCAAVKIIVESSQRANPIFQQCFGELTPDGAGLAIPVTYHFMPKSSAEHGLEIADFIINAAGSQIKRHIDGKDGFAPDFNDVFCQLPPIGCLFSLIDEVKVLDGRVRMHRMRLIGNANSSNGVLPQS
jgi:hypothetical protein